MKIKAIRARNKKIEGKVFELNQVSDKEFNITIGRTEYQGFLKVKTQFNGYSNIVEQSKNEGISFSKIGAKSNSTIWFDEFEII